MADKASDIDHVWKLIDDIPIAMVVTHEGQGQNMRSRPMAARPAKEEGVIYFLTDAGTPKAEEIRRNQSVCLALSDTKSQRYVSISGHAEMIDDRERIKKYWSIYDKAFWADKNDPNTLYDEITTFDHALTRPWTVTKQYARVPIKQPEWVEEVCAEGNGDVEIRGVGYFLSGDGHLMPVRPGQAPPDLRNFREAK